ncbi:MAG: TolC family protein [Thermotogota bacterium]|nr:TolC family protein [Thermotogota bacterium]
MKKFIIFIAVLSTSLMLLGQSPKDIIDTAKEVNLNYRIYELNMEKNQLDYDKALIEAINKKSEIAAEINRLNGENQTQGNLSSFYSEILNHIFEVKTQEINHSISEISLKIAELDYQDSQNLFDKGLISSNALQNASITLGDAKTDLEQKQGDLEMALKNYKEDLGMEWEPLDIFVPDYNQYVITNNEWLEDSKTVQISEYNLEMAEFDIENLSLNASKYDQKIADISLEQKKIDLSLARENTLDQKRDLEDSLYFLKKQLETLKERLTLSNDDLEDVKTRHEKGLVSDTQLFNQEKSHLSVLSQYNATLKSYWTTLSNYVINSDQDVEEALRANLEKVESEALQNE